MKKLGLDIHGVINKSPNTFSKLSSIAKDKGYEVHILTGSKITKELKEELKGYGMKWDKLFSILDYHEKEQKIDMWQDSRNNWWIDDDVWNKTKGMYCKAENIDLHIDDTKIYGKYFDTPFLHFTINGNIEMKHTSDEKDFTQEIINELLNIDNGLKIKISENIW